MIDTFMISASFQSPTEAMATEVVEQMQLTAPVEFGAFYRDAKVLNRELAVLTFEWPAMGGAFDSQLGNMLTRRAHGMYRALYEVDQRVQEYIRNALPLFIQVEPMEPS